MMYITNQSTEFYKMGLLVVKMFIAKYKKIWKYLDLDDN